MMRFTAEKARNSTIRSEKSAEEDPTYIDIISGIKASCSKGETMIWYYEKIPKSVRAILVLDGYNIMDNTGRDGILIKISW